MVLCIHRGEVVIGETDVENIVSVLVLHTNNMFNLLTKQKVLVVVALHSNITPLEPLTISCECFAFCMNGREMHQQQIEVENNVSVIELHKYYMFNLLTKQKGFVAVALH